MAEQCTILFVSALEKGKGNEEKKWGGKEEKRREGRRSRWWVGEKESGDFPFYNGGDGGD